MKIKLTPIFMTIRTVLTIVFCIGGIFQYLSLTFFIFYIILQDLITLLLPQKMKKEILNNYTTIREAFKN